MRDLLEDAEGAAERGDVGPGKARLRTHIMSVFGDSQIERYLGANLLEVYLTFKGLQRQERSNCHHPRTSKRLHLKAILSLTVSHDMPRTQNTFDLLPFMKPKVLII